MLERRIRYAKDKSELIKKMVAAEDTTGPFKLNADVLVFAASLGLMRGRKQSLMDSVAEPIRQEVFDRQGYDTVMNLIAVYSENDPSVLANTDDMVERRAVAFEEYANGGLEILQEELRGAVDVFEAILLIVNSQRKQTNNEIGTFDLTKLAS